MKIVVGSTWVLCMNLVGLSLKHSAYSDSTITYSTTLLWSCGRSNSWIDTISSPNLEVSRAMLLVNPQKFGDETQAYIQP